MSSEGFVDLEDLVIAVYSALDDALRQAGIKVKDGKLIPRPGRAPDVDDREILCIAVLEEVLGRESDNSFYEWFCANPVTKKLFPRKLSRQNYSDRRVLLLPLIQRLCRAFCDLEADGDPPLFIIDAHPVEVCRLIRAGDKERLDGLARKGYCPSLKTWFYGVKEQLIYTPSGMIAHVEQIPGNRHDVQGLYALLFTSFCGHLVGDNGYWPSQAKRKRLAKKGITVTAPVRSNWHIKLTPEETELLKRRSGIERRIGLFDGQFHAARTRCRSRKHYEARRWLKALAHNLTRHVNRMRQLPFESVAHYRLVA